MVNKYLNKKHKSKYIPLLLLLFALIDLKTEIRILYDHFTMTSVVYMIRHHFLAIYSILISPILLK